MEDGREYVDPRLLKRIDDQAAQQTVDIGALPIGTYVTVRTRNSTYRLLKTAGRWMVQGGARWKQPTAVDIAGATFGGSTIMAGHLGVSMYMELWDGPKRITTSAIESIEVH